MDVAMGKEVFLAMGSPVTFEIWRFKIAFKDAIHQRRIYHRENREGYNFHFRATMGEVRKLIVKGKKRPSPPPQIPVTEKKRRKIDNVTLPLF